MPSIRLIPSLLAFCTGMIAPAQFLYPAHFNVELKDSEDQAFMVQIQLRADRWVRNNYPQAFDWQGNYVSDAERLSLDSLDLVSSGTWQLSLSRSAGYDTLALVGFTKNFKQTRILFYSGPTGLIIETIDAPRYVLPLENYHEFLSVPELDRVTSIVQNELMGGSKNLLTT